MRIGFKGSGSSLSDAPAAVAGSAGRAPKAGVTGSRERVTERAPVVQALARSLFGRDAGAARAA